MVRNSAHTPPIDAMKRGLFTFIDLFAGIGGTRMAFEAQGGKCVFTSEWNKWAQQTYKANFEVSHPFVGDIVPFPAISVPEHDILVAGFPCQPFSIAGVSKYTSLGREHGFGATQGTLFHDVVRILDARRPKAFLLENVRNLVSHDRGRTLSIILAALKELGYHVHHRVVDGAHFVPQHRERIYIIGFRQPVEFSVDSLVLPERTKRLHDILHRVDGTEPLLEWDGGRYFDVNSRSVAPRYTLSTHLWQYLREYAAKHKAAGNGFGFGLVTPEGISRTLSARYYKDGSEILIAQGEGSCPRRLTPRECARLMGFPDSFRIPVSDTQAYKQFGNSVVVPAVTEVARIIVKSMSPGYCMSG